jgi:hypothetical protein
VSNLLLVWAAVLGMFFATIAAACPLPSYNLPIPFNLYASGAAGTLVLSFVIVGWLVNATPHGARTVASGMRSSWSLTAVLRPALVRTLRIASVTCLLLTIVTGLFGGQYTLMNLSTTMFWIVFVLGFAYLTALVGNVYEFINPWRVVCDWIGRSMGLAFTGRADYPERLGYYPALVFYMALIWIELFGNLRPMALSLVLIGYTCINIAGAWWFGANSWFRYGELFGVFFGLLGKLAPLKYVRTSTVDDQYDVQSRAPFVGLLDEPARNFSLLIFILFMLSSTSIDGAHETLPWVGIFWKGVYPLLTPFLGANLNQPYLFFVDVYYVWQWVMLIISPFAYLALYLAFIWLAKLVAGSDTPVRTLALRFALTLVPIAFVYNVTHYFTMMLAQGFQIVRMISDPFNLGWNLFGTGLWDIPPIALDAGTVWHTQVAFILAGHVVSVYLAHVEALKDFANTRRAMLSQLPMLALMVVFTTLGLWILSLPISAGQVTDTAAAAAAGLTQ